MSITAEPPLCGEAAGDPDAAADSDGLAAADSDGLAAADEAGADVAAAVALGAAELAGALEGADVAGAAVEAAEGAEVGAVVGAGVADVEQAAATNATTENRASDRKPLRSGRDVTWHLLEVRCAMAGWRMTSVDSFRLRPHEAASRSFASRCSSLRRPPDTHP
jgi:hypothetical protein